MRKLLGASAGPRSGHRFTPRSFQEIAIPEGYPKDLPKALIGNCHAWADWPKRYPAAEAAFFTQAPLIGGVGVDP